MRSSPAFMADLLPNLPIRKNNRIKSKKIFVVIPFKDKAELTNSCLNSLLRQSLAHHRMVVCLVDNNSSEDETSRWLKSLDCEPSPSIQLLKTRNSEPFNFSRINNLAIKNYADADTDYVLLLNNDICLHEPDSVLRLIDTAEGRNDIACTGCTLQYPDKRIQHLYANPGIKTVGAHPYKGLRLDRTDPWYSNSKIVPAVTGAVMLIKKDHYISVGGFDENLPNCYQDIDLCLKFQQNGLHIAVATDVVMTHFETQTRDPKPHWGEVGYIYRKWGDALSWHFLVPKNISRFSERPIFTLFPNSYPWWRLIDR
ncbi:MAG: glycosyltransferase [Pseudobacteriovorax sp.]|nr:glycosyltransferase [Pseudobacteriovorax sp.]